MAVLQIKRATAARWWELNPILENGEPGFEYDTGRRKTGDGVTPWQLLEYDDEKAVLTVNTFDNLPQIGKPNRIYKVTNEKALYQWNDELKKYEKLVTSGGSETINITLISGGNANG